MDTRRQFSAGRKIPLISGFTVIETTNPRRGYVGDDWRPMSTMRLLPYLYAALKFRQKSSQIGLNSVHSAKQESAKSPSATKDS